MKNLSAGLSGLCVTLLVAGALLLVLAPSETLAQGCAMCATYLSGATDPRAYGFKVSIMFLMAMPFVVVGSAGGWILWMHRRSRVQRPSLYVLHPEGEGTP